MASTDADVDTVGMDLFQDPEDYYPPTPPPTTQTYTTTNGDIITLHLVGRMSYSHINESKWRSPFV